MLDDPFRLNLKKSRDFVMRKNENISGVSSARSALIPVTAALRARLQELIAERGIKGYRDFAYRSGSDVSYQTIRRIMTGDATHIRTATLQAIAETLRVDLEELTSLARDATETQTPWVLPPEFDHVPMELRPPIEAILRSAIDSLLDIPNVRSRNNGHTSSD